MIETLETIRNKTDLNVDTINALLLKNYSLADIARMHNVNPSSVTRYIQRHYDKIAPIVTLDDSILIAKSKRIVHQGMDQINDIFDNNEFDKKDLPGLTITTGTVFDKMRILQNKSTQNVSMDVVTRDIDELGKQIVEVEAEIAKVEGKT